MSENTIKTKINASADEQSMRKNFFALFKDCPIPDDELLSNLSLFIKRQDLSSILFMVEIYKKIVSVHGVIMEFGVRWGRNLALFESLRGIYEPFNHNRKIVGFDTFRGFPSIHAKDGTSDAISVGAFSVTDGYQRYLDQVLDYHEQESPIAHIKKYRLIQGDASVEVEKYLNDNPETIIALAYFDLDIYEPTKKSLQAIKEHLARGSVIGFDQLNTHDFPGETRALKEVFGLSKYKIIHTPYSPAQSYMIFE
ncbi:MAG: crotonobetainyl-CoA--carnitine CoA-transferase [bacterium]